MLQLIKRYGSRVSLDIYAPSGFDGIKQCQTSTSLFRSAGGEDTNSGLWCKCLHLPPHMRRRAASFHALTIVHAIVKRRNWMDDCTI